MVGQLRRDTLALDGVQFLGPTEDAAPVFAPASEPTPDPARVPCERGSSGYVDVSSIGPRGMREAQVAPRGPNGPGGARRLAARRPIGTASWLVLYLALLAGAVVWRFRGGAWRSIERVEPELG